MDISFIFKIKKDSIIPLITITRKITIRKKKLQMNSTNLSGLIMQITKKQTEKGNMALGTISVYRSSDKATGKAVYDYIPFIAFGFNADRLSKGATVGLSGRMQSYQVPVVGEQYPETKIQLFVNSVDTFQSSAKPNDEISINDSDMPGFLQGGNN